ncbi:hypothetical protein WS86_15040 [Burkholderia savannae]|uniref:Uncharacterized protein n=1 Tax=Burkholderia savannae TaxID=1637837 RepID=A0ABR5TG83_9BURK|nr:hypothetical protein WS86_15040 [Burkholderia savannae]KWZ44012.1 hypothetical protein WS72_14885 [Burkholderia savannae]
MRAADVGGLTRTVDGGWLTRAADSRTLHVRQRQANRARRLAASFATFAPRMPFAPHMPFMPFDSSGFHQDIRRPAA